MGMKPRAPAGGLLDGVNSQMTDLERRVSQLENHFARIRLEVIEAGFCSHGIKCTLIAQENDLKIYCGCLQCRLYREMTREDDDEKVVAPGGIEPPHQV